MPAMNVPKRWCFFLVESINFQRYLVKVDMSHESRYRIMMYSKVINDSDVKWAYKLVGILCVAAFF